ncbi:hypothetical protein [Klenkia brasiliensis]|nr:hypothetical protein [Klenkia brasiliensis]
MSVELGQVMGADGARLRSEVAAETGTTSVSRWIRDGRLLRPLPGVLVVPDRAGEWRTRATAAVLWSRRRLCGRSALYLADLVTEAGGLVHVATGTGRHLTPRRPDWVQVRVVDDLDGPVRQGLPVTRDVVSLVDCWGHAHSERGGRRAVEVARGAVIGAVRRRRVTADQVHDEVLGRPRLPGRGLLLELVAALRAGAQSEFEVWGMQHVLDVPGLPAVQQQYALETAIGTIRFDGALEAERLGIELDGAAYHRSPDHWARDRRRDAAALALDWATLRIDYRRAHADPAAARAEIAAAFHARAPRIARERAVI